MDLPTLITRLESFDELTDGTALKDMSPTYFEVDGDVFKAALEKLRAYQALLERVEASAVQMEDQPTGRFIAGHLRELVRG